MKKNIIVLFFVTALFLALIFFWPYLVGDREFLDVFLASFVWYLTLVVGLPIYAAALLIIAFLKRKDVVFSRSAAAVIIITMLIWGWLFYGF